MTLLDELVPPVVVVEELREHPADLGLYPVEEAYLARAVETRRREFAAVRRCARAALARLGKPPAPILPGERGAPCWPPGILGSMTHCTGYAAAALARCDDAAAVGIDAEPNQPLPNGVLETIVLPPEAAQLAQLTASDRRMHWDRLLFSAKESVYKSWFPLTGRWLGFDHAQVSFDPARRRFSARLLVDGPIVHGRSVTRFDGGWAQGNGLLVTAVVLL